MNQFARSTLAICTLATVCLAVWAYSPGLSGGFLFDDFVNLTALGEYGGVRDSTTLGLYLTSGLGDPFGRPLSMLSFLLDASNWPAPSRPLLYTNILLHLINGLLLGLALHRIGRARKLEHTHAWQAAIVGAGIWMLHPLFLSTTLYIVQREAMLPATFTLLALLAWLAGRNRLQAGKTRTAWVYLCIGALGCTAVAALCKANGLLIPLLLMLTEATVLADESPHDSKQFTLARRLLLGVPVAVFVVLMISSLPRFTESATENRPWSLAQRILTEPRVLLDYVGLLGLPQPISRGVFHDDFAASSDWLHPWSTLPAILTVVAAIAAAWHVRKRWPVGSFAVLFFFAGHSMESSVVPLELYFEHRNYLPAMVAFWPLALWLSQPQARLGALRLAASILIIVGLAADTHLGAQIWGRPEQLALAWAARNPDSARAQAYAAQYEVSAGANAAAIQRLNRALTTHPEETQLVFNLVDAQCAAGGVPAATLTALQQAIQSDAKAAALDFSWLRGAVERARAHACAGLDLDSVAAALLSVRSNPKFANAPGRAQDFDHIEGLIALARNEPEAALVAFDHAVADLPQPAVALEQAALLGNAGRSDLGLKHLDAYLIAHPLQPAHFGLSPASLHAWLLDRMGYWRDEFARMRRLLAGEQGSAHAAEASANIRKTSS
jgi:hypothetical protein